MYFILTGEPTHKKIMVTHISYGWSILLCFIVCYVQPVIHSNMNQKLFLKHFCNHYEKYERFSFEKKSLCVTAEFAHLLSAKMSGTQNRTLVSPWRMHCTYCSMPKGTSRAEVTSNSEKIKSIKNDPVWQNKVYKPIKLWL